MDRWSESYDWALWFRAAERIPVPAGGIVPGLLDLDPAPPSTVAGVTLVEGWQAWWHSVVYAQPGPPLASPPDFAALARWPALQEVVARRWTEAHDWHTDRKRIGLATHLPPSMRENEVVSQVERALGRQVAPFRLDLAVLPVRDEELRQVDDARYLVSEHVYDGPRWPELLRPLVTALGR